MRIVATVTPEGVEMPFFARCTECAYRSLPARFVETAKTLAEDHAAAKQHIVEVVEDRP